MRRALLTIALLLAACSPDRTAILVEVTSALGVPDDVDGLRFQATSEYGGQIDRSFPIADAWPHSLTIVPPEGERMGRITITVTGLHGGSFVVRRVVETSFVPGETRTVSVELSEACRDVMCDDGVDCRAGACVGAPADGGVDGGPIDDGGLDGGDVDDGGPIDGGPIDAGLDAAMGPDSGTDAGPRDAGTDAGLDSGPRDAGTDAPMSDAGAVFRCTDATCVGHVVISEVSPRSAASGTDEFVELHNPTDDPVDITGVLLQYVSSSGGTVTSRGMFTTGAVIAPHGYLLAVSATYVGPPAADPFLAAWSSGMADSGSVVLRVGGASGTIIDAFGWGGAMVAEGTAFAMSSAAGGPFSFERKANAASTSASMSAGGADVLAGNAYDTMSNAADFVARATRDPQSRASAPEP